MIVVVAEEFLILCWAGAGTMGVFINVPVRGILQWPSHPLPSVRGFISLSVPFCDLM